MICQTSSFYRSNAELYLVQSRRLVAEMAQTMMAWSGQVSFEADYSEIRRQLVVVCDLATALTVAVDAAAGQGNDTTAVEPHPFTELPERLSEPIHRVFEAAQRQYVTLLEQLEALNGDLY